MNRKNKLIKAQKIKRDKTEFTLLKRQEKQAIHKGLKHFECTQIGIISKESELSKNVKIDGQSVFLKGGTERHTGKECNLIYIRVVE